MFSITGINYTITYIRIKKVTLNSNNITVFLDQIDAALVNRVLLKTFRNLIDSCL